MAPDETTYQVIRNRLLENLARREANGGVIIGYHGISASKARIIESHGFAPFRANDYTFGVWFWEEDCREHAIQAAIHQAEQSHESTYALLHARLHHPTPDFLYGTPKWIVHPEGIEILGFQYFPLLRKP